MVPSMVRRVSFLYLIKARPSPAFASLFSDVAQCLWHGYGVARIDEGP